MTRLEALVDLQDKVEAGEWFPGLAQLSFGGVQNYNNARDAYNGSLDAALALHEAALPEWGVKIETWPRDSAHVILHETEERDGEYWYDVSQHLVIHGEDPCPARALLLAILAALIEKERSDG